MTDKTCATCKSWNPRASMGDYRGVGAMAQHQMAICDRQPKWRFFPPQNTCPKHEAAAPDVVAKRAVWLADKPKALSLEAGQ